MALALDTSRQFRSTTELLALVRAIATAPATESEPDWLEWKRQADLSDKKWHARIAKFIAGFVNRDPAVAKLKAGGGGYLVIGVEPGDVVGITPIDNADLHSGVSRYLRNTVRWSPQYLAHDGKQILVVTVEPPEFGDSIIAMLKEYTDQTGATECRKGDVFVRRAGKTELATQDDYDMLADRFASGASQVSGIRVDTLEPATAIPIDFGPSQVLAWQELQERALLEPLGRTQNRDAAGPFLFS